VVEQFKVCLRNLKNAGIKVIMNIGSEAFPKREPFTTRSDWLEPWESNKFISRYIKRAVMLIKKSICLNFGTSPMWDKHRQSR
jgi:hypothetical protein